MKNLKYQQRSHHRDQYNHNNSMNDGDPSPMCEEKQLYSSSNNNANGFTDHVIGDDNRNPILEPRATDDSCERLMELTVNDNNYNHHGNEKEKIYQRQKGGLLRTRRIAVVLGVSLLVILHFTISIAKIPGSISSKDEQLDFHNNIDDINPEAYFLKAAKSLTPVTDKVTEHRYEVMYGQFLVPYYERNPKMKMLEIGLGCNMGYGPGASVALWKKIFPQADLWEAEFDGECVEKAKNKGQLEGINVLVGDQMDAYTLDIWIEASGGANFDIVIDDGGHEQCQIMTTFNKLWPKLARGGLYFIEDLHVSHRPGYFNKSSSPVCEKDTNVPHILKGNIEALIHRQQADIKDIKFVFCQVDACVIGKKG